MTLSEHLRQAIQASGRSLNQLQQETGVSRSQLSRFMRGERDISLTVAEKVCDVLGLRFCGPDEKPTAGRRTRKEGRDER